MAVEPEEVEAEATPDADADPEEEFAADGRDEDAAADEDDAPAVEEEEPEAWLVESVADELRVGADSGEYRTPGQLAEETGVPLADVQQALDTLRERGEAREAAPDEWEAADDGGDTLPPARSGEELGEPQPEVEPDPDEPAEVERQGPRGRRPKPGEQPVRALIVTTVQFTGGGEDGDLVREAEWYAGVIRDAVSENDGMATTQLVKVEAFDTPRKVFP